VSRRSSGSSVERFQRRRNRVTDDEINELRSENNEIDQNFSLENMFEFAKNDRYPPKYLYFGSKKKKYSAVLHFFDHQTRFDTKPEKNKSLYFVCKLQNCKLSCNIGEFTNLNKHLAKHESTLKWYNSYIQFSNKKKAACTSYITEEKLNLIKFFITSNLSLAQLKNVYLRLILKDEVKLPSFFTFRYKYLNEVLSLLHDKIEKKCQDASYITLIPDGWTDSSGSEYLGIFYLT
jgi:hypothetical protein